MSLVARVYPRLQNAGPPWDTHPVVVVLEIDGKDECLCIPAFTAGQPRIEQAIESFEKSGISRSCLTMQVDNHRAVRWFRGFQPKPSVHWAILNVARINRVYVRKSQPVGEMQPEYLLRLIASFLEFCQTPPGQNRFSAHLQKRLRKTAEELRQNLKKP